MTNEETRYVLESAERAKRFKELATDDNPTDLQSDLALCRFLAEEATNRGQTALAGTLLGIAAKLSAAADTAKYRRGELLCKTAALSLCRAIVDIIIHELENKFVGWEDSAQRIGNKIMRITEDAKNPPPGQDIDKP